MSTIPPLLDALKMAEMIRKAERDLQPLRLAVQRYSDAIRTFLPPDTLDQLRRVAAEIAAAAERQREEEPQQREFFTLLAQRGWVGLENHVSPGEYPDLLKGTHEHGGEWLDAELCSGAREDDCAALKDIVEPWWSVPYLADRRPIIEDALHAHEEGRYALSIPALMPLVDGLTAEIVGVTKWHERQAIYVRQAAVAYHDAEEEVWSEGLLTVVSEQVFKPYAFGSAAAPSLINRHGVLHGRISGYASEANSLRTVLLIDIFARFAIEKRKRADPAAPSPPGSVTEPA
jgi:hypothetical protein